MRYGKERNGIKVIKDVYGEHFSSEIKTKYTIEICDTIIVQSEDPREISSSLALLLAELSRWVVHFERFKDKK